MTVDLREFPYKLIKSFDSQKGRGVIAFIGSGPSCYAGLPSWGGLIREIARRQNLLDRVKSDLENKFFAQVSDFLSKEIGKSNLNFEVADLIREKAKSPTELHKQIVKFDFRGVVTTNYDLLLTDADERRYFSPPVTNRTSSLISLMQSKNPPFIFHLHGSIQDSESIVLSLNSYNQITKDKSIRQALANLFASYDVLFIGFGFVDDHIREFLDEFKSYGVTNLNVFAVVPTSELTDVRETHLKTNLNVTPIRLEEVGGDHGVAHLSRWLKTLCDSVNQMNASKNNPARNRLSNVGLVSKIYEVISDGSYDSVLTSSLRTLPNRVDLLHLCEMGLSSNERNEVLDLLSPNELRRVLISANAYKSNIIFRDSLAYLPLEKE